MENDSVPRTAIRSAEAERVATCKLADRIAAVSIEAFRQYCPEYLSSSVKQTVVSTIVAQIISFQSIGDDTDGSCSELLVLSVGQGTKVMPCQQIIDARLRSLNDGEGDRLVRDCHAEVLARRGLLSYLYHILESNGTETVLFERNCINHKLRLKSNVRLHLYTSSQPCGNATIKKWAKSSKPIQYPDLSADDYPAEVHPKIQINSRVMGQVAVLVKKNNHLPANSSSNESNSVPLKSCQYEYPTGTAPTDTGEGNVMTCSDKIAKWNALGLQGSLLSQFFEPIYLSTIVVGRKFSKVHCERALCCRLQGFCFPCKSEKGYSEKHSPKKAKLADESAHYGDSSYHSENLFILHHPVMMSTAVKLDEGAILTGNTGGSSTDGAIGAQFADNRSFCMWRTGLQGDQWIQEVLDGKSGLLCESPANESMGTDGCVRVSLLSSYSLGVRYREITKNISSYYECKSSHSKDNKELNEYTSAKNHLITHKDYFPEWIRKM